MSTKADFEYEFIEGVLCIVDLDLGNMSVTNDMENVLAAIEEELEREVTEPIVYKDSSELYDGVEIVGRNPIQVKFVGFGENMVSFAVQRALTRRKWKIQNNQHHDVQ